MKHRVGMVLAAASVAGFALVGPGQADSGFQNKYQDTTSSQDCGEGNTIDYAGPLKMWPPNHKLQDVTFIATDRDADPLDDTTLTIGFEITDIAGGDGGLTHDPDVLFPDGPSTTGNPSAEVPVQLRSERSGKGEGRTYNLTATATFDGPAGALQSCTMQLAVLVPHDMRGGADWG